MKYIANPAEVDAEIIDCVAPGDDPGSVMLLLASGRTFHADKGMTARHMPQSGDYLVTQADGYVYLNPKDVFERKYRAAQ